MVRFSEMAVYLQEEQGDIACKYNGGTIGHGHAVAIGRVWGAPDTSGRVVTITQGSDVKFPSVHWRGRRTLSYCSRGDDGPALVSACPRHVI